MDAILTEIFSQECKEAFLSTKLFPKCVTALVSLLDCNLCQILQTLVR